MSVAAGTNRSCYLQVRIVDSLDVSQFHLCWQEVMKVVAVLQQPELQEALVWREKQAVR